MRARTYCTLLTAAFAVAACAAPDYTVRSVAILHHDGRLHVRDSRSVQLLREVDLGTGYGFGRKVLAQSLDGARILVLMRKDDGTEQQVFTVSVAGDTVASRTLADGADYTTIAVGPVTGAMYLAGMSDAGLAVRRLDSNTLDDALPRTVIPSCCTGSDVSQFMSTADETRFYVEYGQAWKSWLNVHGTELRSCEDEGEDDCVFPASGYSAAAKNGLVTFVGYDRMSYFPRSGEATELPHTFTALTTRLVEYDSTSNRVVVADMCREQSIFDMHRLRLTVTGIPGLTPASASEDSATVDVAICGDRLSLEPQGRWAAVSTRRWSAFGFPWAVKLVDLQTGKRLRRLHTGGRPSDILVLR